LRKKTNPETKGFEGITQTLPEIVSIIRDGDKFTEAHGEIVRLLIGGGYDINVYGEDGRSPLMTAIRYKHSGLFNMLLEKGADVNATTFGFEGGQSVLSIAATYCTVEMVQCLLDKGAELRRETDGFPPLHAAANRGKLDVMTLLLERGAVAEAPETNNRTAMHEAAEGGKITPFNFFSMPALVSRLGLQNQKACGV